METPVIVHKCIEAVKCTEDGGLLMAASALTNRFWMGSMYYWADKKTAPEASKCSFKSDVNPGISDFCFIEKQWKVIAGTDTGAIQIWKIDRDIKLFECVTSCCQHDDWISSVDCSSDGSIFVSGSQDYKIKLWNMEESSCIGTYTGHFDAVKNVAFHPVDNVFISSGQDQRVLLWDTRKPKPAKVLDLGISDIVTCVQWQPGQEHSVVLGTESGSLHAADLRNEGQSLITLQPHTRSITRMEFSSKNTNCIATASEDCTAQVFQLASDQFIPQWKTAKHTDFVRCATWGSTDELFTCSWDGSVLCHSISADRVENKMDTLEIM